MRNKILAILWAFAGMVAGLRVGLLPIEWLIRGLSHFVDVHQKPVSLYLGALSFGCMVFSAALGWGWFYRLFYRGELWGYRPNAESKRVSS
jgi:hypothetical protein